MGLFVEKEYTQHGVFCEGIAFYTCTTTTTTNYYDDNEQMNDDERFSACLPILYIKHTCITDRNEILQDRAFILRVYLLTLAFVLFFFLIPSSLLV